MSSSGAWDGAQFRGWLASCCPPCPYLVISKKGGKHVYMMSLYFISQHHEVEVGDRLCMIWLGSFLSNQTINECHRLLIHVYMMFIANLPRSLGCSYIQNVIKINHNEIDVYLLIFGKPTHILSHNIIILIVLFYVGIKP